MRRTFATVMAAGLMLQLAAAPLFAKEINPVITVSAEGRVSIAPDMATIRIGVSTTGTTAAEALQANNEQLRAVQTTLRNAGLTDPDLQTTGLSVNPQYNFKDNKQTLTGYEASNSLTVRVQDLSRLGEILDQVTRDGANEINGLAFGLKDSRAVEDEARVEAVREARRRAEMMAAAEGVTLGRVVEIRDKSSEIAMPVFQSAMRSAVLMDSPPVEAGEVDYRSSVTMVWELVSP